MIHIVWEFRCRAGRAAEFERHYGPEGSWALLFRRAAGYYGTTLLRDQADPLRYLTVDEWDDLAAFADFQQRFSAEYHELDAICENLTESETKVGAFEVFRAAI